MIHRYCTLVIDTVSMMCGCIYWMGYRDDEGFLGSEMDG